MHKNLLPILTFLFMLFFGSTIFSEQIPLGCDATSEYSTYFFSIEGKIKEGKHGREEKKPSKVRKYLLIDKDLVKIGYGDKYAWREDPYSTDEMTYEWGPIFIQLSREYISQPFDTRISRNKFLNPSLGDAGEQMKFSINRETLDLKEDHVYLSRDETLGNIYGFFQEYFYSCIIIPLNELESVKKEAIENQLKRKKERKLKQKI